MLARFSNNDLLCGIRDAIVTMLLGAAPTLLIVSGITSDIVFGIPIYFPRGYGEFGLFSKSVTLKDKIMLFTIIERFKDNDILPLYKRIQDEGRMLPEGLTYISSWFELNFSRCFQLMECDDLRLLQEWILRCRGSGTIFEVVPVLSSKDTQGVVILFLDEV